MYVNYLFIEKGTYCKKNRAIGGIMKIVDQFFRFCLVGVICFIIDYLLLIFLKEIININVLIAAVISFVSATFVNFILSVSFVFETENKKKKIIVFFVFSLFALILTEAIMFLGIKVLDYRVVKIVATIIVMCFNFVTRKLFLESK